jgi:hypothetical protein
MVLLVSCECLGAGERWCVEGGKEGKRVDKRKRCEG